MGFQEGFWADTFGTGSVRTDDAPRWPVAHIERDRIMCSCGRPAMRLHLLPWCSSVQEIEASCGCRDVGGYTVPLGALKADPLTVLGTLADQTEGGGALELLRWLGDQGRHALR